MGGSSSIARINQVLVKCAKRAEPKKIAQNFPNRLGQQDPLVNSKLLEIHRNEPASLFNIDFNNVTEWISVKFKSRNIRLEKLLNKRNTEKIQRLNQIPSLGTYVRKSDRVNDLKALMNYDVCRSSRYDTKPVKEPKKGKESKKVKKQLETTESVGNDFFVDFYAMDTSDMKNTKNAAKCDDNADLYGDLNQVRLNMENTEQCNDDADLYGDLNPTPVNIETNAQFNHDADLYADLNQIPVNMDLLEDGLI